MSNDQDKSYFKPPREILGLFPREPERDKEEEQQRPASSSRLARSTSTQLSATRLTSPSRSTGQPPSARKPNGPHSGNAVRLVPAAIASGSQTPGQVHAGALNPITSTRFEVNPETMTKYLMGVELLNETQAMMALLARAYPSLIDQTFTDEVCLVRRLKDFVFKECSLLTQQNVLQLRDIQNRVQELKAAEDLRRRSNTEVQSQAASREAPPRGPAVNIMPQRRGGGNSSNAGQHPDPVNPANMHDMTMRFETLTPQQKQAFQEQTRLCQCVIEKYRELHRGVRHGAHAQTAAATATGSRAIPAMCARHPNLHHMDRIIVRSQHRHEGEELPHNSPLVHILQRACEFQDDQHVHHGHDPGPVVHNGGLEDDIHQMPPGPHHSDDHGPGVHHYHHHRYNGCQGLDDAFDHNHDRDHDHDPDGDGDLQSCHCHCECHRGSHIPVDYKMVLRWLRDGDDKDPHAQQLQRLAFVDAVSFMNRLDAMLEEKRREKREKREKGEKGEKRKKRRAKKASSSKSGTTSSSLAEKSSSRRLRPPHPEKGGKTIFQEPLLMGHIFCVGKQGRVTTKAATKTPPSVTTGSSHPTTGGKSVPESEDEEGHPSELTHPSSCGTIRTMFYLRPAATNLTEEALRSMGCVPVASLESTSKRTTGTIMIHPEQGGKHPLFVGQFHSPVTGKDETLDSSAGSSSQDKTSASEKVHDSETGNDEELDDTDKEDIIIWAAAVLEQGKKAVEESPCVSQGRAARTRRGWKSANAYRPELECVNEAVDEQ